MATKKIYLVDTENVGSTWKDLLPVKTGADQILLFFTENSPYVSYTDLQSILQFPDRFEMIKCNPGKNGLDFQLVSYLGYLLKTASKAKYIIVSNDNGFDAVVKFWQERGMSVSRANVYHVLQPDPVPACKTEAAAAPADTSKEKPGEKTDAENTAKDAAKPDDTGTLISDTPDLPDFPSSEADNIDMNLDFSNLTVSEKAALLRKYLPKEFSENQESIDVISDIMFGHDTTNHHQLHLAFVKSFGDENGTLIYKAFRPHLAEFRA